MLMTDLDDPSQGVARGLGMEVERRAYVHETDVLVFGMRLRAPS